MSGTNGFVPFAYGSGANVLSDSAYQSAIATGGTFVNGVVQGQASSQQANKSWRQGTLNPVAYRRYDLSRVLGARKRPIPPAPSGARMPDNRGGRSQEWLHARRDVSVCKPRELRRRNWPQDRATECARTNLAVGRIPPSEPPS